MTISIIEHGDWVNYTRAPRTDENGLKIEPEGVMYAKRVSDDADWYVTVQSNEFANVAILATALYYASEGHYRLAAVTHEPQRIFPQNHRLLEIVGYEGTDAQTDLGGMVYDEATKTLSAYIAPVGPVITTKADIWRRATDAEAEEIVAVLAQQPIRKQRLFNDAQYIDHSDEEWADLIAAFTAAFGEERAMTLLAAS